MSRETPSWWKKGDIDLRGEDFAQGVSSSCAAQAEGTTTLIEVEMNKWMGPCWDGPVLG